MKRGSIAVLAVLGTSCAAVLGLSDFDADRPFQHRAHVQKGISCPECHEGISAAEDEGPLHLPDDGICVGCHVAPHDRRACSSCHSPLASVPRVEAAKEHLRFSHRAHQTAGVGDCARCHEGVSADARQLLPPMAACLSCHKDGYAPERCADCHYDLPAEGLRPRSHLSHGPDYRSRHGIDAGSQRQLCSACHGERFCADCHGASVPPLSLSRAFERNELLRLHPAGFTSRHAIEARAQSGTCSSCHTPETCASCHQSKGLTATGELRRGPHPAGWVSATGENRHGPAARLDPLGCASCHGGGGEALCVGCHKVGGIGGSPHPIGFASNKRSSELPCRLCHLGGSLQ